LKSNYTTSSSGLKLKQIDPKRFSGQTSLRKREFSKSLHEKVLSKISTTQERLSSAGLNPNDWSNFNLEIFKENWKNQKKNSNQYRGINKSTSKLDIMQSINHRRNISSVSKKSDKEIERPEKKFKKLNRVKPQELAGRPMLTLVNQMKADMTRLRQSMAAEGWRHYPPKKTTPPSTKKSSFIKHKS
jgi:hypothetical protein